MNDIVLVVAIKPRIYMPAREAVFDELEGFNLSA